MAKTKTISLIGAPSDIGAGARGTALGPDTLRIARLAETLRSHGLEVVDRGNIVGPKNPELQILNGYRHLPEVIEWNRSIYNETLNILNDNHLPVLLGGDHSLSIGSISAVAQHCKKMNKKLHVLWLDAHADFNTHEMSPTGNMHGMPLACLAGHGPHELTHLAGYSPALEPKWISQVGLRCVDPGEKKFVHDLGVEIFDMRMIDEIGMFAAMKKILSGVTPNMHLHVSFDVDFLDSAIAPGVGLSVPGGPTYREAHLCMEMIADSGCMGSLDIMELSPIHDEKNRTAHLAIHLVESLFGKSTLIRI